MNYQRFIWEQGDVVVSGGQPNMKPKEEHTTEAWREAREGPLEEWSQDRWKVYEPVGEWHYMLDGVEVTEEAYKQALADMRQERHYAAQARS